MYNLPDIHRITAGAIKTGTAIAFCVIALFCFIILLHNDTKLMRSTSQDKLRLYELMKEQHEERRWWMIDGRW